MALTPAQAQIFRDAVKADPSVAALYIVRDSQAIADNYNAVTATTLWRKSITTAELNNAIVWSEFAGLTTALQNTYLAMINVGTVDATQAGIRAGFGTVFAATVSLTNLTALAQRFGTRFETIAGFLTVESPSNTSSVYGHVLTALEVGEALWNVYGNPI